MATILAFYVLALVLMPCTDKSDHQNDSFANTETVFDGSITSVCSPFCSDHECHTHITVSFINSTFVQQQFIDLVAVERTIAIPTPFFSIWQPPKIA